MKRKRSDFLENSNFSWPEVKKRRKGERGRKFSKSEKCVSVVKFQ
jgi:hypothetical protein